MHKDKCSLILLSGGKGKRFGGPCPKQYLPFANQEPLILYPLKQCLSFPQIHEVIVVCEPRYQHVFKDFTNIIFAEAGERRQDSVLSGIQHVSYPWVFIHDGARPFVYHDEMTELLQAARQTGAAALASPLAYALKQKKPLQTMDRNQFVITHTPQCMQTSLLRQGLERALAENRTLFDDVEAAELQNLPVSFILNKHPQLKINQAEDLLFAKALL